MRTRGSVTVQLIQLGVDVVAPVVNIVYTHTQNASLIYAKAVVVTGIDNRINNGGVARSFCDRSRLVLMIYNIMSYWTVLYVRIIMASQSVCSGSEWPVTKERMAASLLALLLATYT